MSAWGSKVYTKNEAIRWSIPNYWDIFGIILVLLLIIAFVWGAKQMVLPYTIGQAATISLKPLHLFNYSLRTVLRLLIALFFSLIATFVLGGIAAKNKHAERIIIPAVDVLQSIPALSFIALTIPVFIGMFSTSMLGPECAAIFTIFTAQAWNMILSFYQSVRTIPSDLKEVALIYRLTWWQRFWRIEVPYAMPGLLWNMMMSMSGSWFFIIASEAISVANQTITLPGIGSYIALAIAHADGKSIFYAIGAMFLVIFLYDQVLFRPLAYWAGKFKGEQDEENKSTRSEVVEFFQRTKLIQKFGEWLSAIADKIVNFGSKRWQKKAIRSVGKGRVRIFLLIIYYLILFVLLLLGILEIFKFLHTTISFSELKIALKDGLITGLRVIVLIAIASLVWVPVGVWIGSKARLAAAIQPVAQFLAAFPANLLFPVVAVLIIRYQLNVQVWVSPLMVLGTQWYILFNVIAGTLALPKDLKRVAATLQVKGWLRWKRVIIPGIAPYFITGAITAAGGAWNTSIVAEVIKWGTIKLQATGLGSYIAENSFQGNLPKVVLGTIVMCLLVLIINRLFWRPLYNFAIEKFEFESD
jgi:NitT/TauT family transport system permease protein